MLPYMKKVETYQGGGEPLVHGSNGPLRITAGGYRVRKAEDDFLDAAARVGFAITDNLHDMRGELGFEHEHKTVSPNGKRQDAATAYVHPLLEDGKHHNLHVLCEHKVTRVMFDEQNRVVGVEYIPNLDLQITKTSTSYPNFVVRARKQVVVSAGALGSPLVLQRSSIRVAIDLPGVGAGYQDHILTTWPYKTNLLPDETLDALWSGRMLPEEAAKNSLLGWSSSDVHGKYRPNAEQVKALGSEFKAAWEKDYKEKPGKPLVLMATIAGFLGDPSLPPAGAYMSLCGYTAYPYSRGHIHIGGPHWRDLPDFETGFFTNKGDIDMKMQIFTYKSLREIMRQTWMYRGELDMSHPKFAPNSEAALLSLNEPLIAAGEVEDIEYTVDDDKAIEQCLRERIGTTWHSLGTCAMKPREKGGVVDKDLNVYGTFALKVIDLSIPPENVGANTQITAYTIGEKGADIILNELDGISEQANGVSH
ncbi:hypothetical protein LTR49_027729 [Elasticomyces elasticus]|nr:hypothetical protein LTR49_027729 [Elasticomyces elasticus]